MKKDYVFFGEQGLTATSANNVANRAKESVNREIATLQNVSLVTKTIGLLVGGEPKVLKVGTNDVSFYREKVERIAKVYALIAWLREGIKAKERLTREVDDLSLNGYMKIVGKELRPEPEEPEYPQMKSALYDDDVIAELSIGDRCRMLGLEAMASVYANFVGPNGSFNIARKDMYNAMSNPCSVEGSGQDRTLYQSTPTVSVDDVDSMFFDLEKSWTDTNSELNGIKNKIEEAIKESEAKCKSEYSEALKAYNEEMSAYKIACKEWKDERNALLDELQAYKTAELERIKALKIIIPNALEEVYKSVKDLAK